MEEGKSQLDEITGKKDLLIGTEKNSRKDFLQPQYSLLKTYVLERTTIIPTRYNPNVQRTKAENQDFFNDETNLISTLAAISKFYKIYIKRSDLKNINEAVLERDDITVGLERAISDYVEMRRQNLLAYVKASDIYKKQINLMNKRDKGITLNPIKVLAKRNSLQERIKMMIYSIVYIYMSLTNRLTSADVNRSRTVRLPPQFVKSYLYLRDQCGATNDGLRLLSLEKLIANQNGQDWEQTYKL